MRNIINYILLITLVSCTAFAGTEWTEQLFKKHIFFDEQAGDPTAPGTDQLQIYSKDVSGVSRAFTQDSSSTVFKLVGDSSIDTFTNKTYNDPITFQQIATPSNPASNFLKFYPKSDGSFYSLNNLGAEVEIGTGGGGFKNFFNEFGNFEASVDVTLNVEDYDDGGAFVDGTGGSPTAISSAHTVSVSEVLEDTGSLQISKAASDGSGEGISFVSRTVDRADQGKILNGSFEIDFTDANYTADDISLKAFDITNAAELAILNDQSGAIAASKGLYNFSIQTLSNTATVRLAFHLESDSATGLAYDVFADDVKWGPSTPVGVPTVTEWATFTPTGSLTTNTTYAGIKRRVGDQEEYEILITFSGTNTQGAVTIDIPGGQSIDTAKINSTTIQETFLGTSWIRDNTQSGSIPGFVRYSTATSVELVTIPSGSGNAHVSTAVNTSTGQPMTVAASDNIKVKFSVPITGFESGAQLSSQEALFSNTSIFAESNAAESVTANVTDIPFIEVTDNFGAWSGTAFLAPIDMDVLVSGSVSTAMNRTGSLQAYINGTLAQTLGTNATHTEHPFSGVVSLLAGESLTLRATYSSTLNGSAPDHWISVKAQPDLRVLTLTGELASVIISDEKSSGTQSGTCTSGSYQTRTLNTIVKTGPSFSSLSANQFILQIGQYRIKARGSAHKVDGHKIRIQNITDATAELIGETADSSTADNTTSVSTVSGIITLTAAKTFELQHRCNVTRSTDGFGDPAGHGNVEVYALIEIIKLN